MSRPSLTTGWWLTNWGKQNEMSYPPLFGIIPPLVTPLTAQLSFDRHALERIIEHVIAGGVNGIFLLGSTGEGPALTDGIRKQVVQEGVKSVSGRVPLFINISAASFLETKAMLAFAAGEGVDYVVLSPPFYYEMNQQELLHYYISVADHSPLPLLVYNAPQYTKTVIDPELIGAFVKHQNIIGIKDSSGSFSYIQDLLQARGEKHFPILIGPEMLLGESILLGCEGGVCGGANLYPALYVNYCRALVSNNEDDMERFAKVIRKIQTKLYDVADSPMGIVIGLKYLLAFRGLCSEQMAIPVYETLTREQKNSMESLDKEIRLI